MNDLPTVLQRVPGRLMQREMRRRQLTKLDPTMRKKFLAVCNDVAKQYKVDAKAMRSLTRQEIYTWPRYVTMKVLTSIGWSLQSVADAFGYECHTTISHGLRSHNIRTRTDHAMHESTLSLIEKHREPKASEPQCQIIAALTQHLQLP